MIRHLDVEMQHQIIANVVLFSEMLQQRVQLGYSLT
jgi:hypothetical protein